MSGINDQQTNKHWFLYVVTKISEFIFRHTMSIKLYPLDWWYVSNFYFSLSNRLSPSRPLTMAPLFQWVPRSARARPREPGGRWRRSSPVTPWATTAAGSWASSCCCPPSSCPSPGPSWASCSWPPPCPSTATTAPRPASVIGEKSASGGSTTGASSQRPSSARWVGLSLNQSGRRKRGWKHLEAPVLWFYLFFP